MIESMNHYLYICFDCRNEFTASEIETAFHYLCPKCGQSKTNQPLRGVLWLKYDFERLKNELERRQFLQLPAGRFWHYPQLWPLSYRSFNNKIIFDKISEELLDRLMLNSNPLGRFPIGQREVLLWDDTRNPTLSFKDRATSLVILKALQMGITKIAAASTGNAGSSLAGLCARVGLHAHLFVPKSIPAAKRLQIQAYGANLYLVDGSYDQAFDLCLEVSRAKGWYNRNTAYNPLTIEGKKSAAYDIFIAMHGDIPDVIFVPVGDGVIISGLFKGFWELQQLGWIQQLPRLIAVQAEGSSALVRYLSTGKFQFKEGSTIADSIHADAPRNLYMAAQAVKESGGTAVAVTDEEISDAQKYIAQRMGILVEPSAAASLAGYRRFQSQEKISFHEKILLLFTGNGLKDVQALESWNMPPEIKTVQNWENEFNLK